MPKENAITFLIFPRPDQGKTNASNIINPTMLKGLKFNLQFVFSIKYKITYVITNAARNEIQCGLPILPI